MVSDGFTKPLPKQHFDNFFKDLGMVDLSEYFEKSA